jgi:hypothetical protein
LLQWWKLPESPRWLIANNRGDEARTILAKYHAGGDGSSPLVDFEMNEITTAIELDRHAQDFTWTHLVATPGNRKRVLISFLLGLFSQWVVSLILA